MLDVAVLDDGPAAQDDGFTQSPENADIVGDVRADNGAGVDVEGADRDGVYSYNGDIANGAVAATGVLDFQSDGTFTYTPGLGEEGTITFTYTLTDADGDFDTATVTIVLAADSEPSVVVTDGVVDEAALADGSDAGSGNDVDTGTFTIDTQGDALAAVGGLVIEAANGDLVDVTGGGVVQGAYGVLTVTESGGMYSWSYVLSDNTLDHGDNPGFGTAEGVGESFAVTVTDSDGDSAVDVLDVAVLDDGPSVLDPLAATVLNSAGAMSLPTTLDQSDGDVDNNYGADGPGAVVFTAASIASLESQQLTSGLTDLKYVLSNGDTVLTAYKVTDTTNSNPVFTIELQPTGSSDQYKVTIDQPLDATSDINFNDGTYDFLGGNTPWAGFVPNGQSPFSPGGGAYDDDLSQDLLLTPFGAGATGDGDAINGNANSAGVTGGGGGQNVGSNEGIRLDFVRDLEGDPAKGVGGGADYDGDSAQRDHSFTDHYDVNGAAVQFGDGQQVSEISLKALVVTDDPDDGPTPDQVIGTGTLATVTRIVIEYDGEQEVIVYDPLAPNPITVTVGSPGGLADRSYTVEFIDDGGGRYAVVTGILDDEVNIATFADTNYQALEIQHLSGDDFALTGFGTTTIVNDPINFTVPISIVDGDGDIVDAGILDITASPAISPVVLDMDGGGNAFSAMSSGIAYDYNGDGVKSHTAWIAAGSAILAFDANADGMVTDASEFVFGGNGMTDLEAVAARFDSNDDGVLDASDAAYGSFGIWLDADLDAEADAGEFVSLSDAGIVSIDLVSNGLVSAEADGEVVVYGTASFTMSDGTTGTVSDSAFATGPDLDMAAMDALLELAELQGASVQDLSPEIVDAEIIADIVLGGEVDAVIDQFVANDAEEHSLAGVVGGEFQIAPASIHELLGDSLIEMAEMGVSPVQDNMLDETMVNVVA